MLQISDLTYRYPGSSSPQLSVPAFSLPTGQHAVVLGPSGCGKSTLLHLIAAILTPQQGRIQLDETDIAALDGRKGDAWRGRTIGFLPQRLALIPSLTVRENLHLSDYANKRKADHERATALLRQLGLEEKANAKPFQLSQGQQQRAAIARAVFNRPRLLLADEPTANLDDAACAAVIHLLTSQASEAGASLMIATHDARVLSSLPDAQALHLQPNRTEEAA